jgi:hypothetical protein
MIASPCLILLFTPVCTTADFGNFAEMPWANPLCDPESWQVLLVLRATPWSSSLNMPHCSLPSRVHNFLVIVLYNMPHYVVPSRVNECKSAMTTFFKGCALTLSSRWLGFLYRPLKYSLLVVPCFFDTLQYILLCLMQACLFRNSQQHIKIRPALCRLLDGTDV